MTAGSEVQMITECTDAEIGDQVIIQIEHDGEYTALGLGYTVEAPNDRIVNEIDIPNTLPTGTYNVRAALARGVDIICTSEPVELTVVEPTPENNTTFTPDPNYIEIINLDNDLLQVGGTMIDNTTLQEITDANLITNAKFVFNGNDCAATARYVTLALRSAMVFEYDFTGTYSGTVPASAKLVYDYDGVTNEFIFNVVDDR